MGLHQTKQLLLFRNLHAAVTRAVAQRNRLCRPKMPLDTLHQSIGRSFHPPGSNGVYNQRSESVAAVSNFGCAPDNAFTGGHHESSNSVRVRHEFGNISADGHATQFH